MSPFETYLFLLTDSFITGLVLPAKQALVFPAMQIFGGYNLYLAGFLSTIGITAAASLNWGLGKILRSLKKFDPSPTTNEKIEKILAYLKIHGYLAASLGFVPVLGPIIIVFTGVIATSFTRVMALVFIVNIIAYGVRLISG